MNINYLIKNSKIRLNFSNSNHFAVTFSIIKKNSHLINNIFTGKNYQ